jgi:hypothetical protein
MEEEPGVDRQGASAGATAQETAPHRCFALAGGDIRFTVPNQFYDVWSTVPGMIFNKQTCAQTYFC